MELEEISKLIDLLRDTDVTEIQIEKEGVKVRVKREKFLASFEMTAAAHHAQQGGVQAAPQLARAAELREEETQRIVTVTAPLVGTFFRSPSPDAKAFVEVGQRIAKGQVLCIVEAMKLMNEIESEVEGVLVRALVDNGSPVEYGEPLFLIEPA